MQRPLCERVQATADLGVQQRAAQKAQREREAQRTTASKSFQYKGGLTIEEHSDEEDAKGVG